MLANTVPIVADLSGHPSGAMALKRVGDAVCGALDHQRVPFAEIVRVATPPRAAGEVPLIRVSLVLEAIRPPRLAGAETRFVEVPPTTPKLDVLITVREEPNGGLHGHVEYDARRYLPATGQHIANRWLATVGTLARCADPSGYVVAAGSRYTISP